MKLTMMINSSYRQIVCKNVHEYGILGSTDIYIMIRRACIGNICQKTVFIDIYITFLRLLLE